jgi:hypothetical protein
LYLYTITKLSNKIKNLQEHIRTILKEENLRQRLITQIEKIGVLNTAQIVGGLKRLTHILGDEHLTHEIKINFIKEIISWTNSFLSDYEIRELPLLIGVKDGERRYIEFLNEKNVTIFHYGGHRYSEELAEYDMPWEELPKDILDKIFNMVLKYGIDNRIV